MANDRDGMTWADTGAAVDWDARAALFDEQPDHGLRDPEVRRAWAERLRGWLPGRAGDVLDPGCGTGSLSLLAAEQGHRVTGVDLSTAMVRLAREKLAGRDAVFLVGDAAAPPVGEQRFDAVLVRHVLWALPDPARALRHWYGLLRPGGRLVLVEGVWGSTDPVGIPAERLTGLLAPIAGRVRVERLSGDALLWGGEVTDERYAVVVPVR
ncbi:class I SAM-dependent methyltransferase [Streptomyces sp.]|uniref:class I SAM-dependent methyltransferase n=1 Tax=Streptomyces sp. TaxID=1931 RepID=UPI002810E352|nr:class I SAM-dependent methyltransferase [Streptomyces sp.]